MSEEVTREEMLVWLDGAENDIYDYVDEGRMLDAIRRLIESRKVSRGFVRKWTGNFGGGRLSDVAEWEIVKMLTEAGVEVEVEKERP